MIFSRLWERYFFSEALKTLIFFLTSLYFIFVLVDFSTHSVHFYTYSKPNIWEVVLYYLHHFVRYLDIFFPLTLMLSTIKVLLGMNTHNEIAALQTAGVSSKQLLRPFFLLALLLSALCYLNFEYLAPKSLDYIENFQVAHSKNPKKKSKKSLQALPLKDQTQLVFQSYDSKNKTLFDVFWIKSPDEIYHAKYLKAGKERTGFYVDHLERGTDQIFEKKASYESLTFAEMPKFEVSSKKTNIPYENRSISSLLRQFYHERYSSQEERANILTHLNLKLATPLFPFLVLIACAPFCLRFSRYIPIFFLYAISLFGLVSFLTMMDAAAILAENQMLSPFALIWLPLLGAFCIFGYRFAKV